MEAIAKMSTRKPATEAFETEMEEIGESESTEALKSMGDLIEDVGVCHLPDSEIEARKLLKNEPCGKSDDETDGEKERHIPTHNTEHTTSCKRSMFNIPKRKQLILHTSHVER